MQWLVDAARSCDRINIDFLQLLTFIIGQVCLSSWKTTLHASIRPQFILWCIEYHTPLDKYHLWPGMQLPSCIELSIKQISFRFILWSVNLAQEMKYQLPDQWAYFMIHHHYAGPVTFWPHRYTNNNVVFLLSCVVLIWLAGSNMFEYVVPLPNFVH